MKLFTPDEKCLGQRTAKEVDAIFNLYTKVQSKMIGRDRRLSGIEYFDYHNGSGRQNFYIRMLRKMDDDSCILGKPIWAIVLRYTALYSRDDGSWDIEATYGSFNRKARYRLTDVTVPDDPETLCRAENEFNDVENRIKELDAATATLDAWLTSGLGMAVRCQGKGCWSFLGEPTASASFSHDHLKHLAANLTDLETLRNKLRCRECGTSRPLLFLNLPS